MKLPRLAARLQKISAARRDRRRRLPEMGKRPWNAAVTIPWAAGAGNGQRRAITPQTGPPKVGVRHAQR